MMIDQQKPALRHDFADQRVSAARSASRLHGWRGFFFGLGIAVILVGGGVPVQADGGGGSTTSSDSAQFKAAKTLIKNKDFAVALPLLQQETKQNVNNADAWNLTGYAARHLDQFALSETAYKKALAIDPKHEGALEYMGELYLKLDQPEKAEALLARLDKLCFFNCAERDDLKQAIADYKAAQ